MGFRSHHCSSLVRPVLFIVTSAICHLALADIEVIVASVGEKSDVGVTNDAVGFMYHFDVSPHGSWWVGHFELDDALDSFHLRGQSDTASDVIWIEEQAPPGGLAGQLNASSTDRQLSINDAGDVVGFARIQEQGVIQGQIVYRYDGVAMELVATTSQALPALPGASYGNDFLSPNIDSTGIASFYADNITGPDISTVNDALTLTGNGSLFGGQQKGVTFYGADPLQRIDPDRYVVASTGTQFIFAGDTSESTATDDIVVVGIPGSAGEIVLQEGVTEVTTATGVELFDVASHVLLGGDAWFVAGDTTAGTGLVIRNGVVVGSEGDPAPNGFNYVGDPVALAADENGNFAWVWRTSNPDPERSLLLVYNNATILVVEHDILLYDVDADGAVEEVRMDRLFGDFLDLELANNYAYFMTELDNPVTTEFFGHGFLRVPVETDLDGDGVLDSADNCTEVANTDQRDSNGDGFGNVCDADLNNDGTINVIDLGVLRSVFFSNDADADFNGDGVVNVIDLGMIRGMFFGEPGPSGLL